MDRKWAWDVRASESLSGIFLRFCSLSKLMLFEFGDDYRPCKLTRHVVGFPRKNWQNDFQFAKVLDYKLFAILQQYSVGKPILVFCPTRKGVFFMSFCCPLSNSRSGVFGTAEQLLKEYVDNETKKKILPWSRPPKFVVCSSVPPRY